MKGYVYILTNDHMPGLVKIGRTSGCPQGRASQLYVTGVPGPFSVYDFVCAPDSVELEKIIHDELSEHRVSDAREFFKVAATQAARCMAAAHKEMVQVWLDEFLPNYIPANVESHVDEANIMLISDNTGEPAAVIREAMEDVTSDELGSAILRVYERMERLKVRCDSTDENREG